MSKVANACVKEQWKTQLVVQVFEVQTWQKWDVNVSSVVSSSLGLLYSRNANICFAGDLTVRYRMSLNL